jgi:HK97 family phage portal protein
MAFWTRFRRGRDDDVTEAVQAKALPANAVRRAGYAGGIPPGGIDEYTAGVGASTQTDRRSALVELHEAYIACPWAWASVNAIARTITAGGLVMDWDTDNGEGQEQPEKPPEVLALERLVAYVNPRQNIRQLLRAFIVDLLVFGDAFLEVVWWGSQPVALYNLDSATTTPVADEHGDVTSYVQVTDYGQRAVFDAKEVIHVSLDDPRSSVFGIPPMQAALLPITAWLHAAATGKEMMRKGLPPEIHADFPPGTSEGEIKRWRDRYAVTSIGPRNIGFPRITKGGAKLTELQSGKTADVLAFKDQARDEIVATFGVPPSKAGIIESGNLGGGTGEEQDITYKVDTCGPIAELALEAFNFAITRNGFGIDGWHAKFREVDYRSSQAIEDIRDKRLRNGSWTLNKYRAEIGEPPVEGGDDAVLVDRQTLVLWRDIARMSEAGIAAKGAPAVAAGEVTPGGERMVQGQEPGGGQEEEPPPMPAEAVAASLAEYRKRIREALSALPVTEASDGTANRVHAQLAADFPPGSIAWVKDGVTWSGPKRVPLDQVDTSNRSDWNASSAPGKVAKLRKRLRKKLAAGEQPKPVVLVRTEDGGKWKIADGHHRFLAAEAEGMDSIFAFTGRVDGKSGAWRTMAAAQGKGERAA